MEPTHCSRIGEDIGECSHVSGTRMNQFMEFVHLPRSKSRVQTYRRSNPAEPKIYAMILMFCGSLA
jgi:hypothetical protein